MHYLKDYRPWDFILEKSFLDIQILDDESVEIKTELNLEKKEKGKDIPLFLHGKELQLLEIRLNGKALSKEDFIQDAEGLHLSHVPDAFTLSTKVKIFPAKNTALEGLYKAGSIFCTQCEAEGFRKITFYPDRPDVLSRITVSLEADQTLYPVLLSNGNRKFQEKLPAGRHRVIWEDPFPKPSYLFAVVSGNLSCKKDEFTTREGRKVGLEIYTDHENADKCDHAMASLKKSMLWDEEVYGLSCDLDTYMIVAVNDFNMGAMENKGLNIFNSKYVLAKPETATDADFEGIESVIAHEYFHNWTGNRVTLRNWFQLSLKEGLTVFRDQEFSADMQSRSVKRIQDVRVLRARQFPEDAGPMAHPIRPEAYLEMNNFYTVTVYEKGAEVVRMIHTILGKENFRKGMDLYFERHDGEAVTCEDFVRAMEDASGMNLSQFRLWYSQAGTPIVRVKMERKGEKTLLVIRQEIPDTPGETGKSPMVIPLRLGFLEKDGCEAESVFQGLSSKEHLILLTKKEESFSFEGISKDAVPSILRGFSAPVQLEMALSNEDLALLLGHDTDAFNRWEAGRSLLNRCLLLWLEKGFSRPLLLPDFLEKAFHAVLEKSGEDPALSAEILSLPTEEEMHHLLAQKGIPIDPPKVHALREALLESLALTLETLWEKIFKENQTMKPYAFTSSEVGKRKLRNTALLFLSRLPEKGLARVQKAWEEASSMTDLMQALRLAADFEGDEADKILYEFEKRFEKDTLVMDKWFQVQALSKKKNALERVQNLTKHPLFSMKNPNKVRALVSAFAISNPHGFHEKDGAAYSFLKEKILEIDVLNPQIGARLAAAFNAWKTYDEPWRSLMEKEIRDIAARKKLSTDIREIVSRAIA
ncbi:aminopeptidase N [Desulfococcaceae bacterium OttesenSCG-928-F15]|nr:aminopeptidase N [Desulfococcaceae bacterium OttesenSCG-928-F15]